MTQTAKCKDQTNVITQELCFQNWKTISEKMKEKAAKDCSLTECQAKKSFFVEESARRRLNKLM